MTITNNGNVRIGTTTPQYKLDVNGPARFQNAVILSNDIWHRSDDGAVRTYYGSNARTYFGSQNGYEFRSGADIPIAFLTNSGDMGIGTAPLAKLDVSGNIYCRNTLYIGTPDGATISQISGYALAVKGDAIFNKAKVKLYGNWPDYVFDDKYSLLPLPELENF